MKPHLTLFAALLLSSCAAKQPATSQAELTATSVRDTLAVSQSEQLVATLHNVELLTHTDTVHCLRVERVELVRERRAEATAATATDSVKAIESVTSPTPPKEVKRPATLQIVLISAVCGIAIWLFRK